MKKHYFFLLFLFLAACSSGPEENRVLVFGTPEHLQSDLFAQIRQSNEAAGLLTDTISSFSNIYEDSLKNCAAVVFLKTPPKSIGPAAQRMLERFAEAGGNLVFVDSFYPEKYYWHRFETEVAGQIKSGETFVKKVKFGTGTAFLLGNSDAKIAETIAEAGTKVKKNYAAVSSESFPERGRFTVTVLDDQVNEPMEMAPTSDGRVFFIEREGPLKIYEPLTGKSRLLAEFDISTVGNYEDGMLGLALSPTFDSDGFLYIYYSPAGEKPIQRLSRFHFADGIFEKNSEVTVLEVDVQRETCCHSGGSVMFGPDGNLWLSTGDNTSSKESDGFGPLDERPGRGPFDAQKSSGNTHDLRGKILRIKVLADGKYEIPEGNLFPKDGSAGRPEIYVMGARNPFRFSVDTKTGYLYWGDVGPDSGKEGKYGPQSYDEWNQARTAGNYGWPYFQADNKAFRERDFATDAVGEFYDPAKPINDSPHNTGSRELPPARPAFIWYPYGDSPEFPMLGSGSRSAMAGPTYYAPKGKKDENRFPAYYEGKMFIYEWARSWIKVVSMNEKGDLTQIEDFLPDLEISKPIDMEFGADGAMYLLEYGANYFADNNDARLIKIEYWPGNRKPVPVISADKTAGALPLKINFSAEESFDYDQKEGLKYEWFFDKSEVQAQGEKAEFTFTQAGEFKVKLKITDSEGESTEKQLVIRAGNEPPKLDLAFEGNRTFFRAGQKVPYKFTVSDPEDGNKFPDALKVALGYLKEGKDLALLGGNFFGKGGTENLKGKELMDGSDCKACHTLSTKSIGPTYSEIAGRYAGKEGAVSQLASKIIEGGNGNWGHSMMAAHPQLAAKDAEEMVLYILSLGAEAGNLPAVGNLVFDKGNEETGSYFLAGRYTDSGGEKIGPLTSDIFLVLRHPLVQAEDYEGYKLAVRQRPSGGDFGFADNLRNGAYLMYKNIDLQGVKSISFKFMPGAGGKLSVRQGSPEGKKVGEFTIPAGNGSRDQKEAKIPISGAGPQADLYFVFETESKEPTAWVDWWRFEF